MAEHDGCGNVLKEKMSALGVDITVSTLPPMVEGPYTTDPFTCPHGTTFWIEPTGDQIAEWVRDGVV